jgi:single-strand DNA-binding protein
MEGRSVMLNQCTFVGNLGADVEVRSFQNGGRVANLRLAVSETWKDKNTGERKERTEWIPIQIFSDGLVSIAEKYLRKGSKVLVQGQWKTRKWTDQSGADRYSTEVVLQGFDAKLVMLDGPKGDRQDSGNGGPSAKRQKGDEGFIAGYDDLNDDVPF